MMRRRLLYKTDQGGLPSEYQRVEYLYRNSQHAGPVSMINASLTPGDIIITGTKNLVTSSGEQAFAGDSSSIEWYYEAGVLKVWNANRLTVIDRTYGDVDILKVRSNITATLNTLGIYRYGAYPFNGKIYYMKIQDSNGNEKYNFLPCYRKSDIEPGFYDTVNGSFYPNDIYPGQPSISGEWELPS